jgi:putative transposase
LRESGLVNSMWSRVLSVSFRTVCGMSERRFHRTPSEGSSRGLHSVWCPKYRRRALSSRGAARCGELFGQIADEHDWEIVAKEVLPDHVHLFLEVGPTDAPAQVVLVFKGRMARRVLRSEFQYRRRFAKVLRSPSHFATSVGYVSESPVRRYIEHQWDPAA